MFVEPCDPSSPERVAATAAITEYVKGIARHAFPDADPTIINGASRKYRPAPRAQLAT
jgi:hypothetical protein